MTAHSNLSPRPSTPRFFQRDDPFEDEHAHDMCMSVGAAPRRRGIAAQPRGASRQTAQWSRGSMGVVSAALKRPLIINQSRSAAQRARSREREGLSPAQRYSEKLAWPVAWACSTASACPFSPRWQTRQRSVKEAVSVNVRLRRASAATSLACSSARASSGRKRVTSSSSGAPSKSVRTRRS